MLKRICVLMALVCAVLSCKFDDSAIWDKLNDHENRIKDLELLCGKINTNVSSLQSIVSALEKKDYVTSVTPVKLAGVEVGYTITFSASDPITIYHGEDGKDGENGKDGKDGYVPVVGVKQDNSDGLYYWILDGEWLVDDSGNRVKASAVDGKDGEDGKDGQDGKDGEDGEDGKDGKDGKDGVAPILQIREGYWYVSYDGGQSYNELGKATGEDGNSAFQGVDVSDPDYVIFNLTDGSQIKLPTWYAFEQLQELCRKMNTNINSLQSVVDAIKENDSITGITPVLDGENTVGYKITFVKNNPIIIYNGKDGADGEAGKDGEDGEAGQTPVIGVRKDADEVYYWTLNGEWILDEAGEKMQVTGKDGANGENGLTPKFKIQYGDWYISYDEGKTWTYYGRATGYDGANGGCIVEVQDMGNYAVFVLSDGSTMIIPKTGNYIEFRDYTVERICIEKWDEDGDGRLSYEEAASVYSLDYAFQDNDDIETFAELQYFTGLTYLWNSEFYGCEKLTTVILPNTVEYLGGWLFYGTNLNTIDIPDSVIEFAGNPFTQCRNLESITGKFASEDQRCIIVDSELISFAEAGLYTYVIPDGVTVIGEYAFYDSGISGVEFTDDIVEIKRSAFSDSSVQSIRLPEGLRILGDHAFSQSGLKDIYIPDSVQSWGNAILFNCNGLSAIYGSWSTDDNRCVIFDGVLKCFAKSGIKEYEIPEGVVSIDCELVINNYSLKTLILPSTLQSLSSSCLDATFSMNAIYCKAIVPPTSNYPISLRSEVPVYVPRESVEAYKASPTWSKYADYIKPYDFE